MYVWVRFSTFQNPIIHKRDFWFYGVTNFLKNLRGSSNFRKIRASVLKLHTNLTLKNQWDKYLEDASYILLSLYSFPDWPSYECQTEGVRRATSVVMSLCEFWFDSSWLETNNPSCLWPSLSGHKTWSNEFGIVVQKKCPVTGEKNCVLRLFLGILTNSVSFSIKHNISHR